MEKSNVRFEIKNNLDLILAGQLLESHKLELPTQITIKAINWQKGIIAELKTAIKEATK